jgi:hypothetical protein
LQGRERLESLAIRVAIQDGSGALARTRFLAAVERLEAMDVYSATWFVGECGGEVAAEDAEIWSIIDRFGEQTMVQQFVPLAARYTALRDMADRQHTDRLRQGRGTEDGNGPGPAGA